MVSSLNVSNYGRTTNDVLITSVLEDFVRVGKSKLNKAQESGDTVDLFSCE